MYQPSINFDIFKWGVILEILNGIDWSLWKLKDVKPMIHFDIWQNQYNILKLNKIKKNKARVFEMEN